MTTMPYIRHRARMVQESVFQDLKDTLITCRWMPGTTGKMVTPPGSSSESLVTTASNHIFPLAEGKPVILLDYFPEEQGEAQGPTAPNTFALDNGRVGDSEQREMGSNALEQPYIFNMAFWAVSDAVADAVFSDLKDRYEGRIVRNESIALYDWVETPDGDPVVYMEIESFRFARDLENAAPAEVHLFYAELSIVDFID